MKSSFRKVEVKYSAGFLHLPSTWWNQVRSIVWGNCELTIVTRIKYLGQGKEEISKFKLTFEEFLVVCWITYIISEAKEVRMLFPISWMIWWISAGTPRRYGMDVSTGCDVHWCTDTVNHGPASTPGPCQPPPPTPRHWPTTTTSMDTFYK